MKKNKFNILLACLLLLVGCSNEEFNNQSSSINTLTATAEGFGNESRVGFDLGNGASFFWNSGDAIAVGTNSWSKFTTDCTDRSSSATFTGYSQGDYAVYPFRGVEGINGNTLTYNFSSTYNYGSTVDTDFFSGMSVEVPMWAPVVGNSLSFRHLGGLIAFKFPNLKSGANQTFTLKTTNGKRISGNFDVLLDGTTSKIVTEDASNEADQQVVINFTLNADATAVFYVPVPVGTYNLFVELKNGEDTFTNEYGGIVVNRREIRYTSVIATNLQGSEATVVGNAVDVTEAMKSKTDVIVNNITSLNPESTVTIEIPKKGTSEASAEHTLTISTIDSNTTTLNINESTGGDASISQLTINVPSMADAKKLVVNMPNTTVTVAINGMGTMTLAEIIAYTAENTLVVEENVVVELLKVQKGNVRIKEGGIVNKITNDSDNTIYVIYEAKTQPEITINQGKVEVIFMSAAEWDLRKAIAEGGTVTLSEDVTLTSPLFVENTVTLNLNDRNITTTGESFYVQGVVSAAICVKENGNLTVIGEGTIDSQKTQDYAVEVRGGELNIEGGKYVGCVTSAYALTGTINISGGEFTVCNDHAYDYAYVLNLLDGNGKNGTASINVTGGKFYKFNPAVNASENPGKDYVQAGYSSVAADDYYIVSEGFKNELSLRKAIAEGGTVTLSEDITLTSPLFVENTVTLNLNGKNITTTGESFYVQGVVSAAICVKENGNLTVIGEGTIDSQNTQDYAVEVRGGELNIEGGKYVGCVTSAYAITGTINISGGEFTVCNDHAYDYAYVLNLLDANGKNGTASINVTGGKFYKFNPAVNASENPGKDYVQAGYSSVATDDYYVVSEGVKNELSLRKAIAEGGTVTLSEDIALTSPLFVENTVTLNLNGKNITTSGDSFYVQGVVSAAVCVKENGNLTVIGEGTIDSQNTQDYAVEVRGGELNIEGGKYVGCVTSAYALTGTINISGGEFTVCNDHAYDYAYVLNLLDGNGKNGTASINVTGGKFYKFNPAVNASENPGKDYVQAGYSSVAADDYYVVSEGVKNELSLRKAIAEGGTVTLSEDITLTSPLFVENTVTLNLNGKNITTTGESFYVQGVVSAAICVKENGNLTVIGEGTIDSQNTQDYAVEVRGGELNIKGGKYVGCVTSAYALTGTINISGGEFTVCNDHAYDYAYVLNLLDANGKNGTASINVTGGKFYKFNPAVNASENPGKDYVQAGYSSVADDDYYVVSEGTENE